MSDHKEQIAALITERDEAREDAAWWQKTHANDAGALVDKWRKAVAERDAALKRVKEVEEYMAYWTPCIIENERLRARITQLEIEGEENRRLRAEFDKMPEVLDDWDMSVWRGIRESIKNER